MCNKALHLPIFSVTPLVEPSFYGLLSGYTLLQELHIVTPCYGCYRLLSVTITNMNGWFVLHFVTGVTLCYTMLRVLQMLHPRHLIINIKHNLNLKKDDYYYIFYEERYDYYT